MDASSAPRRVGWLGLLPALLVAAATPGEWTPATVEWLERVEVASGEAYQGPWRMNESRFRYVDDPTVAFDGQGSVAVAWVDQLWKDVFFQVYSPEGRCRLPEPTNVSRSPGVFSWHPRMVVDARNRSLVYVLWQEIVFSGGSHGGEIFFARSTDGGQTFERSLNLSKSRAGDGKGRLTTRLWHNGSLDLAQASDGTLYAAWTEYEGALWLSCSTDSGKRFSRPSRIVRGGDSAPARAPSLATEGKGTVYLAWAGGEDLGAEIHVARSDDGGRSFGPARVAFESSGHADAPRVAVGRRGTVHLVFGESPTGPFRRYRILYTRSTDGGHRFAEPRVISDPMPEGFASASFPALALDGQGALYVLWELSSHPAAHPQGLGFTVSSGIPPAFAAPTLIPGSADPALGHNGGRQGLLLRKLAVHPDAGVAVVNSTFREGEASHIWLFRGRRPAPDPAETSPRPSYGLPDGPSPRP